MSQSTVAAPRSESYGQKGLSLLDRFGVYLSRRAILRRLPAREGLHALDLGCGYRAMLLQSLSPHLESGVGVDLRIDPDVKNVPRLSFVEETIESALPALESDRFDVVLLVSVLEHLAEPLAALEHCRRVLRPGGTLFVNVPTWRGKFFLELSAFRLGTSPAVEMDDHKMYYDKRDIWPLLVRAGFRPSRLRLRYHKFSLNLFATAQKSPTPSDAAA
jgi:SAM-dependent methyltransferase